MANNTWETEINNFRSNLIKFLELGLVFIAAFSFMLANIEKLSDSALFFISSAILCLVFVLLFCVLGLSLVKDKYILNAAGAKHAVKVSNINLSEWAYHNLQKLIFLLFLIAVISFFVGIICGTSYVCLLRNIHSILLGKSTPCTRGVIYNSSL